MSTRTPFFSSGPRQEPRTNGDQQDKTSVHLSEDQPNPDTLVDAPEKTNDIQNSNLPGEKDTQHKPLNVNGLIRSRTHPKPPQRILVNEGSIPRPGTVDPGSDGQHFIMNIAAPMPFKASRIAPPLLANASNTSRPDTPLGFKTPSLPYMHQNGDTFSNNAHIPTDSSHEDASVHLRPVSSLSVSRNMDGKNTDNASHRISKQQYASGKRKQNEAINTGQLDQYQKNLKRLKGESNLPRNDARGEKPEAEPSLPYDSANSGLDYGWSHRSTRGASGKHHSDIDSEENGNWATDTIDPPRHTPGHSGALDGILGRDVNTYVEECLVDKYRQASDKWKECSFEEWSAGAEDIMSKYSKILDFVKERMRAKVNLYASMDKKIEQHENALAMREEKLSGAQTQLVHESEGVLGRSLGI